MVVCSTDIRLGVDWGTGRNVVDGGAVGERTRG